MIKITAGIYKNKKLETIDNFVRPTSALKREAFFSIIQSYTLKNEFNFSNKKILIDLFAGIGTIGLEALSRGYEKVIFIENNYEVIKILKKNCKYLCKEDKYEIIEQDVFDLKTKSIFKNVSVIYIDPPYLKYSINKILLILQDQISKDTIIAVESSKNDNFTVPKKLNQINTKIYGKTKICFFILS